MRTTRGGMFVLRVRMLSFACLAVALIIIGRLYFLQVIEGHAYAERANAQFSGPLAPRVDRGTIYFTDKQGTQITAATMKDGYSIAVNPTKVTNPEALYTAIAAVVPIDHNDFIAKATKPGTQYQLVADHLTGAQGMALQKMQLPGLILSDDTWRYYPGGPLAAQTLGFVAYNGDEQEGRYGLERFYNSTLTREDGDLYTNFFVQLFDGVQSVVAGNPESGDITTTIEPSVQAELEQLLAQYNATWHPQVSGGIVMDPQTGEIYAMAVSPTFDLNQFNEQTDPLIYANPLVQNDYEIGSIIKPLTMAAGIDSGAVTPETTYDDTGCLMVDKKQICNYDHKARGVIPMQQILSQSLNVGASYIAGQMGSTTMRDYFLNHYGLGQKTGIDLPGEIAGLTGTLTSPRQVDYDTASFGQGMAITPVETIRALSTLANGGYLVTPHLTKSIHYDTGIIKTLDWPKQGPVLKPQTTTDVSRMLTTVVDTVLAGGKVKFDHYSVAAKTGTGQIADHTNGGYYADRYLHSYFGYFPSYNAKFIILLYAFEPVGAPYASETWSDTFHSLVQFLINYYNVPPDR